MKSKNEILLAGFFLFGIIFLSLISGAYTKSNPQYTASSSSFSSVAEDVDMCGKGEDFILQLTPFGCTPAVVPYALLAEQNVPVYCQIMATKINPLITVDSIESLTFNGSYSSGVQGVGFLPSRVALGTNTNINTPIDSNIGYAVIVLSKQKNVSATPNYASGNLTAKISYDIKNAFGIGSAEFYLPEMNDEVTWQFSYPYYGFWNSKAFLRAQNVQSNSSTIEVYYADEGGTYTSNQKVSLNLNVGQTSSKISLPAFDCAAKLQVKLNSITYPQTLAVLKVNSETVSVPKAGNFLDNRCKVYTIESFGSTKKVEVVCREDEKTTKTILSASPKLSLKIKEATNTYSIGQKVTDKEINEGTNKVKYNYYLVFAGTKKTGENGKIIYDNSVKENLIAYLVKIKASEFDGNVLDASKLNSIALSASGVFYGRVKTISKDLVELKYSVTNKDLEVTLLDYASASNSAMVALNENHYKNAVKDYQDLILSYSSVGVYAGSGTYAEEALKEMVELANKLGQNADVLKFCEDYKNKFGNIPSGVTLCNNNELLANSGDVSMEVMINNQIKKISLERVQVPTFEDYGAIVIIQGKSYELEKDKIIYLEDKTKKESITLVEIISDSKIKVKYNLKKSSGVLTGSEYVSGVGEIELRTSESFGSATPIYLEKAYINRVAHVSIVPSILDSGSGTTFEFRIPIEKSSIELNPDKVRDKIKELNETIKDWNETSEKLGQLVSGMKGACLATGVIITAKNFVSGLSGETIAREKAMENWREICTKLVSEKKYSSVENCYMAKSDDIDKDVANYKKIIEAQNSEIKNLEYPYTTISETGEKVVKSKGFGNAYMKEVKSDLQSQFKSEITDSSGKNKIDISDNGVVSKTFDYDKMSISEVRQIDTDLRIIKSGEFSQDAQNAAKDRIYTTLAGLQTRYEQNIVAENELSSLGLPSSVYAGTITTKGKATELIGSTFLDGEQKNSLSSKGVDTQDVAGIVRTVDTSTSKTYFITYDSLGIVKRTYLYESGQFSSDTSWQSNPNPLNIKIQLANAGSYNYKINSNEVIRYHSTEPYKNLPAVVPFDFDKGWYAATVQTTETFGKVSSFDASGRVSSFWLCNVMSNGAIDFERANRGDDSCTQIYLNSLSSQTISGLTPAESKNLIDSAVSALETVSKAYREGITSVKVNGRTVKVGSPAVSTPAVSCFDVMSPSDCKLLFNVCDPVICPSSRCDFGGSFPVQDVIQSGIIGGLLLCAPNWVLFGGDVWIPFCLSAIYAGLDGWISVLRTYRDCLQTNLDDGSLVGVCDELYSINLCDFFWSQSLPLAKMLFTKTVEIVMGENKRGGGEYMNVAAAWQGASKSMDYFSQYYSTGTQASWSAFQTQVEQVAKNEVCKSFLSIEVPSESDVWDKLTAADSPPQFTGRFDEKTYSTATNPPTSYYKVFYHIYAGKESQVYYKVYLKGSTTSSYYQDTASSRLVASGYISKGQYKTETLDFTAVSGYKQLCIIVNGQEECGFGQVSTDFALDYLSNKYSSDVASTTDITTESACLSTKVSTYSLLSSINMQSAAENALSSSASDLGIVRVCATNSPGAGSDSLDGTANARWVKVGYCGDKSTGCWLDTNSVKEVIKFSSIENSTLSSLSTSSYLQSLSEGKYLNDVEFNEKVNSINEYKKQNKYAEMLFVITEIFDKVYLAQQKAHLTYLRAIVYGGLAGVKTTSSDNAGNSESPFSVYEESRCAVLGEDCDYSDSGTCNEGYEYDFTYSCCCPERKNSYSSDSSNIEGNQIPKLDEDDFTEATSPPVSGDYIQEVQLLVPCYGDYISTLKVGVISNINFKLNVILKNKQQCDNILFNIYKDGVNEPQSPLTWNGRRENNYFVYDSNNIFMRSNPSVNDKFYAKVWCEKNGQILELPVESQRVEVISTSANVCSGAS